MVGWDVSHKHATFTYEEAAASREVSDLAAFCVDIKKALRDFGESYLKQVGFDLPDPIAMAVAIEPEIATVVKPMYVEVEADSNLTRGATVVDHLRVSGNEPNTDVVLEASREGFLGLLHRLLRDAP